MGPWTSRTCRGRFESGNAIPFRISLCLQELSRLLGGQIRTLGGLGPGTSPGTVTTPGRAAAPWGADPETCGEWTLFCHAISQACATVHMVTRAMGLPPYELSTIVHRLSVPLIQRQSFRPSRPMGTATALERPRARPGMGMGRLPEGICFKKITPLEGMLPYCPLLHGVAFEDRFLVHPRLRLFHN
ncbi:MAG: putative immunity protein [Candidatus Methanomethylophilaceae archaeon]